MNKRTNKFSSSGVTYWASFSDMMAGLILIFALIIAVTSFISRMEYEKAIDDANSAKQDALIAIEEASNARDDAEKKAEEARIAREEAEDAKGQLEDIVGVRRDIISKLMEEFSKDGNIAIDRETGDIMLLSQILFDVNKSTLKPEGTAFLNDFIPRYIHVLMNDDIKDHISEIIIEGHTDPNDTYIYNLKLSQDRARSVAVYCLTEENKVLNQAEIAYLETVLSANGKSYSELKYFDEEKTKIDYDNSRRVEIKFRLSDEGQIDQIVQMMQKKLGD